VWWILLGGVLTLAAGLPLWWLFVRRLVARERLAERRALDAERLAEIGAMTSGLAHEIRNPLSTIGLNAQLLAEGIEEASVEQQERDRLLRRVTTLRREAERLRDILEHFLGFAGEMHLDRRRVDLNVMVDELADFFLPQAQQARVRLRVDPASTPVEREVDVTQMKQALLNLMINATQAMESTRDERDRNHQPSELILRVERTRDQAGPVDRLHVIDTGPGIPADRMEKIFRPYFSTRSSGTGLGLAISRRIVEEHGGRLEVRSEVGRGTDFAITLPRDS
jgi:signal transduction histidine kinase